MTKRVIEALSSDGRNGINHGATERRTYVLPQF